MHQCREFWRRTMKGVSITVHSYKGGTGKSIIALNLAYHAAKKGYKALLVESDFAMPIYAKSLNIPLGNVKNRWHNRFYNESCPLYELIFPYMENFDLLMANPNYSIEEKVFSLDLDWHAENLSKLIRSFRHVEASYDLIIFDSPPGYNLVTINNLFITQASLLVIRPSLYAIQGLIRMVKDIHRTVYPEIKHPSFAIFNQVPRIPDAQNILNSWTTTLQQHKIKVLGKIEYDDEIA